MADLIPVHGGLSQPVDRTVPEAEHAAFKAAAEKLTKVPVSQADLSARADQPACRSFSQIHSERQSS